MTYPELLVPLFFMVFFSTLAVEAMAAVRRHW
jgi:hypothetical protein